MDILTLSAIVNGYNENVDISSNTPVVLTLKVGGSVSNSELTKVILDNLIALQNGSDFGTGTNAHTHDARYYTQSQIGSASGTTGSQLIGDDNTYNNFTPASNSVKAALQAIDSVLSGAATGSFSDAQFNIYDDFDNTKKIVFQVGGLSTSSTRFITMPDFNVNLGALTNANIDAAAAIAYSKLALTGSIVNADISGSAAIAYSKLSLANSIVNADISSSAAIAYSKLALTASIVDADIAPAAAIAYSKLALSNSIVNADISASAAIAYSKLDLLGSIVNADISASAAIAYSKLALTGSIVNADINASAAIAYSKLALSNSIVNADINASAAIALSKLASLTANRALQSNGSGVISVSSATSTELGYLSGVTSAIQTQIDSKLSLSGGTMTGSINLGGFRATNGADPIAASDLATKNYVDNAINGLSWKMPVYVATTANITLSGEQTIDGVLTSSSRVLVKDQSTASQNGIYVSSSGSWIRSPDMDALTPIDEFNGAATFVLNGTVNGNKAYVETSRVSTIGSDPVNFAQFSAAGAYVGGNGISISGSTIAVNLAANSGLFFSSSALSIQLADSTLALSGSGIAVAAGGITNTHINASAAIAYSKLNLSGSIVNTDISSSAAIAYSKLALTGSIVNADISGSAAIAYSKLSLANSIVNADIAAGAAIAYSKLNLSGSIVNADINASAAIAYSKLALTASIVNADIAVGAAIAYSKLSLTGSIVNADISASAAIAYSKLALTGSIVNADINASAAIDFSKMAALTASRALQSDGSGFVSVSSVTSTELGYLSGVTSAIQTQLNGKTSYTANNHGVVLSGAANVMTVLAPDASTSKVLVSGGASADPSWQLLTNSNLSGSAAISNANLASMANNTVKANISGSSATPSDVSAVSAATASTFMVRDSNANVQANNVIQNVATTATAAGTTTLTVASAPLQQFTGTTTQTVVLPNATTLQNGTQYTVLNRSTGAVTVNYNGGSLAATVGANTQITFTLISNGTSAGTWDVFSVSTGFSGRANVQSVGNGVSSVSATYSSTLGTTNYSLVVSWRNTTDANPQFQPLVITAKSATGFTVSWNAPTDSANYLIEYIAVPFV